MACSRKDIISLIRPYQYIKNVFVFLPLFFALKITEVTLLSHAMMAFVSFSLTASSIYIFNDYCDIEDDRRHPLKCGRPLAAGKIRKPQAVVIMLFLAVAGLALMAMLSLKAVAVLAAYLLMNIAYSLYLKHIAILDVIIIAVGFVLRLFVGSAVTAIPLSMWIVVITFLLALFMALAKRRDDVLIYLNTGEKMRHSIDGYNLKFLDAAMVIMASVVIVAYTIYTTSVEVTSRIHSEYLYLTSLFVIIGILRYLQITFVMENSGSPTRIVLQDLFMQLTILAWGLTFVWILY